MFQHPCSWQKASGTNFKTLTVRKTEKSVSVDKGALGKRILDDVFRSKNCSLPLFSTIPPMNMSAKI